MKSVSEWLAPARKSKSLSQAELAGQIGVSQATLSQWERGKQKPTGEQLEALRAALGDAAPAPNGKGRSASGAEPAQRKRPKTKANGAERASTAVVGFEEKLWAAADTLRGSMDAAEYKHVVLGLIFLKYISDAFDELHKRLAGDGESDPEDRDEYVSKRVFWVPESARWKKLQAAAKSEKIGTELDKAMEAIERDNPSLKGTRTRPRHNIRAA